MPQLDILTYFSQISWFYLFFLCCLIFVSLKLLPNISNIIKFRINII